MEEKRLFAVAIRKIRTYLPEPVPENMILLARTVLTNKNMSVHQCPLVVVCVCT